MSGWQNAATAFQEIMSVPDKGIPGGILDKAECVVIVPGMTKARVHCRRLVRSRRHHLPRQGQGELGRSGDGGARWRQCRLSDRRVEATDVVMLVMNRTGIESLLKSKFTLGGDASVAGGPVGRSTTAETDAAMKAKILSYSRSRGAFAGVSLTGMTLNQDEGANKAVYGKELNCGRRFSVAASLCPRARSPSRRR